MAFKKTPQESVVPDSPDKLLLELPRRKIPDVLPHQSKLMQAYASQAIDKSDVALQLPTGSGKTLVGLMIGEWRRRRFQERVVYLCPTKQLVNQAVEQAEEKRESRGWASIQATTPGSGTGRTASEGTLVSSRNPFMKSQRAG